MLSKIGPALRTPGILQFSSKPPIWSKKELKTRTEGFLEDSGVGAALTTEAIGFKDQHSREAGLHWARKAGSVFPGGHPGERLQRH